MPATLARIIHITNSPDATSDQVASIVRLDQSLTTKVLRLANSAYYGRRSQAETVSEAINVLGFNSIRNLAASASVVDALFPRQMFPGFGWQEMWIHSVTCAVAAEVICQRMRCASVRSAETAFIAGLLHDVGKLVVARALPARFRQIVEDCQKQQHPMVDSEKSLLSTDHANIGGQLAQQWDFPEKLGAAISYHHAPEDAYDHEDLARVVNGANLLAKRMSRNYLLGVSEEIGLKDVAMAAGLPIEAMDVVVSQVRDRIRQCGEILAWGNHMPGAKALAA